MKGRDIHTYTVPGVAKALILLAEIELILVLVTTPADNGYWMPLCTEDPQLSSGQQLKNSKY